MPLSAIRFRFREDAATRRFRRLSRLLDSIQSELAGECSALRSAEDRMTDCAAFACEALENGECPPSRVDMLDKSLAEHRQRLKALERQRIFISGMRSWLEMFLRDSGQRPLRKSGVYASTPIGGVLPRRRQA